ncbi:hypothetical protein [Actinoplanes sp. L3-i22]|uniref:hypothetical protein n=1 Tax=Actinoplanes sp. L3-i22 TaxID=2836373 RepID=UPI001C8556D3|nr:hypothetical protein [Actinoplanes sp. L3-i22]
MTLERDLAEWHDCDGAAFVLGQTLGLFPDATRMSQYKGIFWSVNPVGDALHNTLVALAEAGVLEQREEPDLQFRWNAAGPPYLRDWRS